VIDLIFAHPYPHRSRSNRALLEAVADLPSLEVRSLYDLYPDFAIDIEAEQAALVRADVIVFQHPLYWYSVPPLLKLWFDKVLAYGFAYGDGERALRGKICQWVTTTGGGATAFQPGAMHGFTFDRFVPPLEQTARFCGMRWEPPLVVHGAREIADDALRELAQAFRTRLLTLARAKLGEEPNG
jgi:glutathione-regulated potassium-efflux system ancillary protein KefF